jgi:hypothetical protein
MKVFLQTAQTLKLVIFIIRYAMPAKGAGLALKWNVTILAAGQNLRGPGY